MIEPRAVAQAIDALRRGWPVRLCDSAGTAVVLAIETADDDGLPAFDPHGKAGLLLSGPRAATLRLANQRDAADPALPVLIERAPWLDLTAALAVADPVRDLAVPLKGPFHSVPLNDPTSAKAAIELARLAGLLPALFFAAETPANTVDVASAAVLAHGSDTALTIVTRARLPIMAASDAEIVGFRNRASGEDHVALIIGSPDGAPPLVRLHSECLTGDVFGSLKCDCGPQLQLAIERIAQSGWGVLLYLRQEGRGIGLINKLRAYALQDQGFDTVDANLRLGFAIDARDYAVAAAMLRCLKQDRIRLLTNNPDKVRKLEQAGIKVVERVPHALPANPHNAGYLDAKRDRTGHQL